MNLRRIGVLYFREIAQGPRNFLFIFALIVPVVMTLLISLLFGTVFSGKPKLGLTDQGDSQVTAMAHAMDALIVKDYDTPEALREAVAAGAVDIGMVLPPAFDQTLARGEETQVTAYTWGESLQKDRVILGATVIVWFREIAGQESPVDIVTITLGDVDSMSWEARLMPFVVLMTIILGAMMVPATSLVEEKQKRTLGALTITPMSLGEVFVAKGMLGVSISMLMGMLILFMNRSFGLHPYLLMVVLFLGAIFSAEMGILLGALIKDINTLFATIKGTGIIFYAPAIFYMFPTLPQWIGKFFPTYYMIQPIVELTQQGAGWPEIAAEVFILIGLIFGFWAALGVLAKKVQQDDG